MAQYADADSGEMHGQSRQPIVEVVHEDRRVDIDLSLEYRAGNFGDEMQALLSIIMAFISI